MSRTEMQFDLKLVFILNYFRLILIFSSFLPLLCFIKQRNSQWQSPYDVRVLRGGFPPFSIHLCTSRGYEAQVMLKLLLLFLLLQHISSKIQTIITFSLPLTHCPSHSYPFSLWIYRHLRVWAIHPQESFTFCTKERAPILLCLEVLDYSDDTSDSRRHER